MCRTSEYARSRAWTSASSVSVIQFAAVRVAPPKTRVGPCRVCLPGAYRLLAAALPCWGEGEPVVAAVGVGAEADDHPGVAECLGRRAPRPGRVVDRGELPVLVEEPVKHVVGVEVCTGD